MIYIIPTKKLKLVSTSDDAVKFAKNNLTNEDYVSNLIDEITSTIKCTHTAIDTIRVTVERDIPFSPSKKNAWSEALILDKALSSNLQSSKFVIRAGINCPYEIEKNFRTKISGATAGQRFARAIKEYNEVNNEAFTITEKSFTRLVVAGFLEKKALSSTLSGIDEQKERLMINFKKHVEFRIRGVIKEFLPAEPLLTKKNEKKYDFSLER